MARKAVAHSPRILFVLLFALAAVRTAFAEPTLYFVHNDYRGAPVAMSDMSQKVVWRAQYLPFGGAIVDEDPDGDGKTVTQNARLPGQYYDKESGLYYNYYRDYDPSLGRYIQSDLIGILNDYSDPHFQIAIKQGLSIEKRVGYGVFGMNHLYGYVDQNPMVMVDPMGLRGKRNSGRGYDRFYLDGMDSTECRLICTFDPSVGLPSTIVESSFSRLGAVGVAAARRLNLLTTSFSLAAQWNCMQRCRDNEVPLCIKN